jgi:beta-phosphoglucomutase-like phosphatase (HAD superfamily)
VKILDYKIIFWDFDGVVKESVNIKTEAFAELFVKHGNDIVEKLTAHHISNGGMSRYKKIPLYASWAGLTLDESQVIQYSNKFSELVVNKVINADWVPGVEEVLRSNFSKQKFVLISATPDDELKFIVESLNLTNCFDLIFGSSISKSDAMLKSLNLLNENPKNCLMIGDALADYEASKINNIEFILRQHDTNDKMNKIHSGIKIKNFLNYESIRTDFKN